MRTRTLWLLLLPALVMVVVVFFLPRDSTMEVAESPLLFPELTAQLATVNHIHVRSDDQQISLSKQSDIWGIDEFDSYPARAERIKSLLTGLTELRLLERKTARTDRYHRLGVEGITIDGSQSVQVQLLATDKTVVADVILGLPRKSRAAVSRPGLYIRLPDEAQSWLVSGELIVSADRSEWFERKLFDFADLNIRAVAIAPSAGEHYRVYRESAGQSDFSIDPILTAMKAPPAIILNKFASLLRDFYANAVCSVETCPLPQQHIAVEITMFEGLILEMKTFLRDDLPYAKFSIRIREGPGDEAARRSLEELVRTMQPHLQRWVFQIPEHKYDLVKRPLSSLLKPTDADFDSDGL